jgi:aromatic amino acid aminotransferase I
MAPPSAISIDIEGVTDTQAVILPNPLTVNDVAARRAKAGKLVAGTAAFTTSDFFKGPVSISSSFKFAVLIVEDFWQAKS